MSTYALEFEEVVKRYRRRRALAGFNLRVQRGTITGLVGSNGAGKTTALSIAAGMIRPGGGTVSLLGEGGFDPVRHAGRVALLPQDCHPPRTSRVRELLMFYARLQGLAPDTAASQVHEVLEWVHLGDRADSIIRTLSHGMRRRVIIAQAFLGEPELILLDEPLSGLDPREVVNIRRLLRRKDEGQTIVISSHNLHEIELACDHVAFIELGKTVRHDSVKSVTRHLQAVTFLLGCSDIPLDHIEPCCPGAEFVFDSESGILTCHFGEEFAVDEVNRRVIRVLLDLNISILEVRRGSGLEKAYLEQAAPSG